MKPPTFMAWIIGNSVVFIALSLGTLFLAWHWFTTREMGLLTLAVTGAASLSYKANSTVRAYQSWQQEWRAMNGNERRPLALPNLRPLRLLAGIAAWLAGAWFAVAEAHTKALAIPICLFWLGSLGLAAYGVFRLFFRRRRHDREPVVTVCLAKPLASPSVRQAIASLPRARAH